MPAPADLNRRDFLKLTTLTTAALSADDLLVALVSGVATPRVDREKVRVGLIGCGSVSGAYLPSLTKQVVR